MNECDKKFPATRLVQRGRDLGQSKSIRVGFDNGGAGGGGRGRTTRSCAEESPVFDNGPKVDGEGGGGRMLN
jgi:hypothetical protein